MSGPERRDRRSEIPAEILALRRHRDPGDAWVTAGDGNRYWGRFGAAGLLVHDPTRGILLQHRVSWSDHGDTWGIPGGARHRGEDAVTGAIRESHEEAGVPVNAVLPRFAYLLDRGGWTYTTVIAEVVAPFEPEITDPESRALAWVPMEEVATFDLHPGFGASWPLLKPLLLGGAAEAGAVESLTADGRLSLL